MNSSPPENPAKVRWDTLSAFGTDEAGNTYLDAVRAHCCTPVAGDDQVHEAIAAARDAFNQAGQCQRGKEAAWEVLEGAGLILLPVLMQELGVNRQRGPRAAFYSEWLQQSFILTYSWRLVLVGEKSEKNA